jgi:outer membrane protein W
MTARNGIAVAFAAVVCLGARAEAGQISYGAKVGIIMSNLSNTPESWEDDTSYKTGFTGGVFMNYAFNENFSLQPELLYTMKGVEGTLYEYEDLLSVDVTASFDYLEIPLLAVYAFPLESGFRPRVYAGPSFAYNLSSELEISALIFSASADISSLTQVTDFGIVAGAGFDYPAGKGMITFDARFQMGFTNVLMTGDFLINGSEQTISGDDFKNYGFAFMAGYGF